jgi:hypothetical protein
MSKNSKNMGLSYGVNIFRERERESEVASGEVSGGPGGPTPYHGAAWPCPHHHMVWWHGWSPWGIPGASLPHF